MTKNCGTCGKCRNTHDGPHCYKGRTPKPVSPLMVMDCWTDPAEEEPASVATKVCSRCGRELPITEFGRHSRTKDGYQPLCKACLSEQNKGHNPRRAWKKAESALEDGKPKRRGRASAHPDYIDEETGQEMHWCSHCKQYKPTDRFNKNRANASGLESYCKECATAHERERRARKRAEKKAAEAAVEAAAKVAAKVAHEYAEAQPAVNFPAGGIRLPETIQKTMPEIVVRRELKLTKSVTVEAYLTAIGKDEDGRKGYFRFDCFASELDKLTLVWNKSPLTVTLAFNEIQEA